MAHTVPIPLPVGTIDLTGRTFGTLTVLEYAGRAETGGHAMWLCLCDCGEKRKIRGAHLRAHLLAGRAISCGHLRADPDIRAAARDQVNPKRRRQIAAMGGLAKAAKIKPPQPQPH